MVGGVPFSKLNLAGEKHKCMSERKRGVRRHIFLKIGETNVLLGNQIKDYPKGQRRARGTQSKGERENKTALTVLRRAACPAGQTQL